MLFTFLLASSVQLPVQQADALECTYICDLQLKLGLGRSLDLANCNAMPCKVPN